MIEVEHGMEIHKPTKGRHPKYPFNDLVDVGDAFFLANKKSSEVGSIVNYWNKKLGKIGREFRCTTGDKDGSRGVWVQRVM